MTDTLLTLPEPKPSDRIVTADLMARLQRHYIKPGAPLPGGVFLPEVGWNATGGTSRCDAIYVGFTSASGRLLVGHEVKASRADWLNELNKPGKADAWADQCHEWWLVTIPGVVRDGELPDGWGLMHPGTSKTRMKVITRARRHHDRRPSWDAARSIIARQDTLRSQAIYDAQAKARDAANTEVAERVEKQLESALRARGHDDASPWRDRANAYERILGVRLIEDDSNDARDPWRRQNLVTETELTDLVALLKAHGSLRHAADALLGRYSPLTSMRQQLDDLERAIKRAQQALTTGADMPTEVLL